MSPEDLKKEAARKAITLINDNAIVGLGAGSTVGYMLQFLKSQIENYFRVQLVNS